MERNYPAAAFLLIVTLARGRIARAPGSGATLIDPKGIVIPDNEFLMSNRMYPALGRWALVASWAAGIAVAVLAGSPVLRAQENAKPGGQGRLESETGMLLHRAGAEAEWKAVAKGAAVPAADVLLALPGVHAAVASNNGGVRLTFFGNVPQVSLTPALESAATLQRSTDSDLDVYLDRGRILVANTKTKGAATVRIRARKEIWDLTLREPGAEATMTSNARWAPGQPYRAQYAKGEEPRAEMVLLVTKGTVEVTVESEHRTLRAPPGPALFGWDSNFGLARTPQPLDK